MWNFVSTADIYINLISFDLVQLSNLITKPTLIGVKSCQFRTEVIRRDLDPQAMFPDFAKSLYLNTKF